MSNEKQAVPGRQRKGYQASDLKAAMTDPEEGARQAPRVEVPRAIIETMRITGRDRLTSTDHAIYYALVALAKVEGIDAPTHTVRLSDLSGFVGVHHVDRVKDSLRRLSEAVVTYDFEDEEVEETGWLHLFTDTRLRRRKKGEPDQSTVTFAIPALTRAMFLDPAEYAKVEILAYPRFSCRYTSRLYPRLALRAGMKRKFPTDRLTWTVEPATLAEEIGFPCAPFRFSNFERDCLIPVMRDIEKHVVRFEASYELLRGASRGRPVEKVVFVFSPARMLMAEARRRHMTSFEKDRVAAPDPEHARVELPSDVAISKACTLLGRGPYEVSDAWRAALSRSKADPACRFSGGLRGGGLLYTLERHGADRAFEAWVNGQKPGEALDTIRPPARLVPVSAAAPKQEREPTPAPSWCHPLRDSEPASDTRPVPTPVSDSAPRPKRVNVEDVDDEQEGRARTRSPFTLDQQIAAAKNGAQQLAWLLDGYLHGPNVEDRIRIDLDDDTIASHLDCDVTPWTWLSRPGMPPAFRDAHEELRHAFKVLTTAWPKDRRMGLHKLARALAEWDAEQLVLAARAIPKEVGLVGPKAPRAAVPSVLRRTRDTQLGITELHAEYGCPDPYSLLASASIDDHDLPDDDTDEEIRLMEQAYDDPLRPRPASPSVLRRTSAPTKARAASYDPFHDLDDGTPIIASDEEFLMPVDD